MAASFKLPLALFAPFALVGVALAWKGGGAGKPGGGSEPPPPPVNTELGSFLYRVGLDAEALAAAGVRAAGVASLVAATESRQAQDATSLASADSTWASAKLDFDRLSRKVQSGLASPEEITACQAARASRDAAQASRATLLDGIFEAGIAGLSIEAQDNLRAIRRNREWALPVPYLVTDRSQADSVDLREALDVRTIHDKYGADFPAEVVSYLATVEAESAIAIARVDLDTYLASVQTAWNAAVSE